ncbi:hypothetical protein PR202_ga09956 [Eleusine coracana subsp. coracana]|uniref:FORGETTER1 first zinc ribbon domain-containing protein n=1 Tax=Eleusine coracana subsp. coracana TaxID=191504 RepID=A0AAV5C464_ELECO|nr:hypothetical protein PR202_ga09956 [Eleusine coracana subsp. coracana]
MSKPAFYHLLHFLDLPSFVFSSSITLPPDHKLGTALFRLVHAAPARAVSRHFGLPSPAVTARAFYEVCRAAADRLAPLPDLAAPDRIFSLYKFALEVQCARCDDALEVERGLTEFACPVCAGTVRWLRRCARRAVGDPSRRVPALW